MHYFPVIGGAQPEPIFAFSKKEEAEGARQRLAPGCGLEKRTGKSLKKANHCIDKGRRRGYTE